LTERKDDLLAEISDIGKDVRTVKISLAAAEKEEGKLEAQAGETEIISALTKLVDAAELAIQLNAEYFERRKSYGAFVPHDWPYSNNELDLHRHEAWLRDVKKYLGKKER
jgi:hypothetical protein